MDSVLSSKFSNDISCIGKTYDRVNDVLLTIFNGEEIMFDLHKPVFYFTNAYKLCIRFETVRPCNVLNYLLKIINFQLINKLTVSMIPATGSRGIL
jgi:hypothetical protein